MRYGTFKSEVWAHNENAPQEYFRYEVITRYWWVEERGAHDWKSTVMRIDRNGEVDIYGRGDSRDVWNFLGASIGAIVYREHDVRDNPNAGRKFAMVDHNELLHLLAG